MGHGCGNDEAGDEGTQILCIEHPEDAACGGTEHLAHAYLLALRLGLEQHEAEDTDE